MIKLSEKQKEWAKYSLFFVLSTLIMTSCCDTIHEHPDAGCARVTLTMNIKKSGPELYTVIEYDGTNKTIFSANEYDIFSRADMRSTLAELLARTAIDTDKWDLRLTWELHDGTRDDIRNGDSRLIERRSELIDYTPDLPRHTIEFDAPAGLYTLLAWADFVPKGTTEDYYYDTSDFNALLSDAELRRECTNNDQRDCFAQAYDFRIESVEYAGDPRHYETTLIRPQGRYVILADDYATYSRLTDTPVEENRVEVYYPTFINVGYSILEQRPNEGEQGLSYHMHPRTYDFEDKRMICVGDDYSFVNGEISYVHVTLGVFTPEGNKLSENKNIEIPLYADKLTVVIGKFLATSGGSGGISVDDGFADEIIVPYSREVES